MDSHQWNADWLIVKSHYPNWFRWCNADAFQIAQVYVGRMYPFESFSLKSHTHTHWTLNTSIRSFDVENYKCQFECILSPPPFWRQVTRYDPLNSIFINQLMFRLTFEWARKCTNNNQSKQPSNFITALWIDALRSFLYLFILLFSKLIKFKRFHICQEKKNTMIDRLCEICW